MTPIPPIVDRLAPDRIVNPFATRWVRPGALPYIFAEGSSAMRVIEKLQQNCWRGSIVGPHGTGKSTLLVELARQLARAHRDVEMITLHNGQRRLPAEFWYAIVAKPQCVIVVDGFEQLGWWPRRRLIWSCRREGRGLLISVHHENATAGLPVIHRTCGDLAIVQHLVDLELPSHQGVIGADDVSRSFRSRDGNVREVMFDLYDLFEQRRKMKRDLSALSHAERECNGCNNYNTASR